MDEYARIGARLRATRDALGYTQQRLADEIGVAASTYSRYESGAQKITIPELRKVAALLGLPLEAALGGEAPDPPLVPEYADRIAERAADKLAERFPAMMRAFLAEQVVDRPGQPPQQGGSLGDDPLPSCGTRQQAPPRTRPARGILRSLLPASA